MRSLRSSPIIFYGLFNLFELCYFTRKNKTAFITFREKCNLHSINCWAKLIENILNRSRVLS
jgi:hypothetical protein